MILDKKMNVFYKNTLNQILSYVIKFGSSDETMVYLYNYIDKQTNTVYPVIILNQLNNPWSDNFYPINLFITSEELIDIDIYNSDKNDKYYITTSSIINPKEVKKILKDKSVIIEFEIVDNNFIIKNIPVLDSTTDRNIGYVDKFNNIKSLTKLISSNIDNFTTLSDNMMEIIYSELLQNTTTSIITKNSNTVLKLFYSLIPFMPDRMKYLRLINICDNEVTSTVYLLQYAKSIVIHNFYKYIDIWSIVSTDKK